METPEAAKLALREIEDCLEILSGHVAAGITGSLFLEIVETAFEEKERIMEGLRQERDTLQHCLEDLGNKLRDAVKKDSY